MRNYFRKHKLPVLPALLIFAAFILWWRTEAKPEKFSVQEKITEAVSNQTVEILMPVFSFVDKGVKRRGDVSMEAYMLRCFLPLYEYAIAYDGSRNRITPALVEAVKKENENVDFSRTELKEEQTENRKEEKTEPLDLKKLEDFKELVSEFYVIDSTTYIGREQLDAKKMLDRDMSLKQKDASSPQILIYHTHSQEGFVDSVPGDTSTTIVGAGELLAEHLRAYGYNVVHHTGEYDVEGRDYAYSKAAPAVENILAEYPEIEVIIDLHRDEMQEENRLVTDIDGKPTARFMFFNGLSRTTKTGEIDYLQNPYLDENLAFSFQMQLASEKYYPGLARKIYLKGYRYNMHYRGKSLLIELGAQNNTVEEIRNACGPIAHVLHVVLSGENVLYS